MEGNRTAGGAQVRTPSRGAPIMHHMCSRRAPCVHRECIRCAPEVHMLSGLE